jgi:hypothetical protein
MAFEVKTTYAPELLIIKLTAWPTMEEQYQQRGRLTAEGFLMPHTCALVDMRQMADLPAMTEHPTLSLKPRGSGPHRIAFVVGTPEHTAFLNDMYDPTLAEHVARKFWNEREALKWLFPTVGDTFPLSFLS